MTPLQPRSRVGQLARSVLALSGCADALVHATDEQDLLQRLCDMLVQSCDFRMAWIGYAEQDADRRVRVVAFAGEGSDYLEGIDIRWGEGAEARGPTGTAIRTGRTVCAQSITTDPAFAPWREQALRRGYQSSIAVPLVDADHTFGALNIYATEPDAFDGAEFELLERMSASLADGIAAQRARAGVKAKTELLQAVWDASPDYIVLHAADGRVVDFDQKVPEQAGASRETVLADPARLLMGGGHSEAEASAHVQWVVEHGAARDLEWTARRADGVEFPVEVRLRPLSLQSPDGPRVLALVRDLTDQRRAERERIDAERLASLTTLAAGIAHDFNNLLTGIIGNLEFARLDDPQCDRELALQEAEEAAMRASSLTRQLLGFARGDTTLLPAPIDLGPLVTRIARFSLRGTPIAVRIDLGADLWPVMADEAQISQVVQNLALNAAQAMREGGALTVTVDNLASGTCDLHGDTGCVRMRFLDDGPGIPEDLLPRVFDPWVTTKTGGSGLGLATSASIVHKHRGRIHAGNRPEGGAVFEVCLPPSASPVQHAPTARRASDTAPLPRP